MQIQVHFQNVEHSQWMDEFVSKRVLKLSRFLSPSASVQVFIKPESQLWATTLSIHNPNHDYAFTASGENVYESVSSAIDKATRALAENKRKFKDRISRRSSNLREFAA